MRFSIWPIFEPTLTNFYAIGQILIWCKWPKLTKPSVHTEFAVAVGPSNFSQIELFDGDYLDDSST